jgi:hypothetical protein
MEIGFDEMGDSLFFFHGIGGSDTPSHHHIVVGRAVFPATSGVVENQLPTLGFKLVYFFHQGPEVAVAERGDTISFQAVPWFFLPDGNGNLTGAGNVSAQYNIMNQPTTIAHNAGRTRHFAYIYGGGKYKARLLINPDFEETRHYLGGLEFVDGEPESYNFGDGRIVWIPVMDSTTQDTVKVPQPQFRLTDHLGNTTPSSWQAVFIFTTKTTMAASPPKPIPMTRIP